MNQEKIEKPWAVYGIDTKLIGRIVFEDRDCLHIQYTEGQRYPASMWSSKAVKRFNNPQEAIDYLSEKYYYPQFNLRESVLDRFYKTIKKESIQSFHDLLVSRKSNLLAQSQPKCAKKLEQLEVAVDFGFPDGCDSV